MGIYLDRPSEELGFTWIYKKMLLKNECLAKNLQKLLTANVMFHAN